METKLNKKIVLEDGTEYYGTGFGENADKLLEIVFNTSMAGYQQILSDPSNVNQLVVMTYPLIGGYGINDEDFETKLPTVGALAVKEINEAPSNFRSTGTVSEYMEDHRIPGIMNLDTRRLTSHIRDYGTCKALLTSAETPLEEALSYIRSHELPTNEVSLVSCKKKWYMRTQNARYNVVAVDMGIKLNMIRSLCVRGCNVTVVPYNISSEELRKMRPDGIFLSGGPGNPKDVREVISLVSELKGKYPMFGVGLGHEIMGLALGADTCKLKVGHRGSNHPVRNVKTGKIDFYEQNHSYVITKESLENTDLELTYENVMDGTVAGMESKKNRMFSVQYDISAPVLDERTTLFDEFVSMMKKEEC